MHSDDRCHRCGEPLQPGQVTCAICGTEAQTQFLPDSEETVAFGSEGGPSSVFLLPTHTTAGALPSYRQNTNRFALWIAMGLSAVSIVSGLVYYFHYLRVGNRVTEILPSDTVAYVRLGRPEVLEEAFLSLNLWETSRPVRTLLQSHQHVLVRQLLLDVGLSSATLSELKAGTTEIHVALATNSSHEVTGQRYDMLVFFRIKDPELHERVVERMEPFFSPLGSQSGVEIATRRVGPTMLALSTFEDFVVLCWGTDATLRRVLRNRKRGPKRSLNDDEAFRVAFRDRARNTNMWTYVRYDHMLDMTLSNLVFPKLTPRQQRELIRHRNVFSPDLLETLTIETNIRNGYETTRMHVYPRASEDISLAAQQIGRQPKRTLQAMPHDAILSIALTIEQPKVLLERWRSPIVRALHDLRLIDNIAQLDEALSQLTKESQVRFDEDVWPVFANEIGISWFPVGKEGDIEPMWIIAVHDADRALKLMSRLAKHVIPASSFLASAGIEVVEADHGGQLQTKSVLARKKGSTPDGPLTEVLCWRHQNGFLLVARECATVDRGIAACNNQQGLDQEPSVKTILKDHGEANTALVMARPIPLAQWLGQPATLPLVRSDFVAVSTVDLHEDRVALNANISPVTLAFLWASNADDPLHIASALDGEKQSACDQLVNVVCDSLSDKSLCPAWKAKVLSTPDTACETGLRTLKSLQTL
jgi:hypothetical protein